MGRVWLSLQGLFLAGLLSPQAALAGGGLPLDFRPDPRAVQHYGPAYRYPQAGWIVVHIEGEPYERGYQHGRLLAPEIAGFVRCCAAMQSPKAPAEGWKNTRSLANALFLRRYDREYLEEMKGIADGASAAGARFEERPIDLVDVVGLNSWPEIETLDGALEATPTGLEGVRFPDSRPQAPPPARPMHCSAFAATGPATADGKIVFGHITMFSLYPSLFCNVWLDVKPARGHRVLMQSYPGGIQSGLDYYMNDAGLLVCETTLAQTRFDSKGLSVASRIRQALQYADSIDKVVEILQEANNGLYTNEWLLADIKTNEIAMFELGTARSKLYRSSKHEWFGGTEGFYWGCNNTKDLDVRLETIPGVNARPANVVWHPSDRDQTWLKLFHKYQGKIDVAFGKEAFTTPPVAAYHSLDAKFTTSDLARDLKSWALFGPPLGRTWKPTQGEHRRYPEIRPLVSNPWTILQAAAPARGESIEPAAVDLPDRVTAHSAHLDEPSKPTVPAWHGTLLPRSDADIWLASAFAEYEKIVALERALELDASDGRLKPSNREQLASALFDYRCAYLASARAGGDTPLVKTHAELARDDWYRVASGKGVLLLHELRRLLGDPLFRQVMDSFGRAHAGKEVTTVEFQAAVEKAAGKSLAGFFDDWLKQPGLPSLQLGPVKCLPAGSASARTIEGEITCQGFTPATVDVTVETARSEVTQSVHLEGRRTAFRIDTPDIPVRVVVDKYGWTAKANGGVFSVQTFLVDLENTRIVYGTLDEAAANQEAARGLQQAIRERWSNVTVPIYSDAEVTDDLLRTQHLLLIGRPDCNRITGRFRSALPVVFTAQSFTVGRETYAHAGSAVVAAAENPLNPRYSMVVMAGLGAESTVSAAVHLVYRGLRIGEVIIRANGTASRALVMPARELVHELDKSKENTTPATSKLTRQP